MTDTDEPIDIRPANLGDLPEMLAIERASFRNPYSENLFQMEFQLAVAQLYVALLRRRIVGYLDFWKAGPEIHLINIAVHPDHRRKGVGGRLVDFLLQFARRHRMREIYLDVRTSNQSAIALYERHGFKKIDLRKGYYADNGEDAWVMGLVF